MCYNENMSEIYDKFQQLQNNEELSPEDKLNKYIEILNQAELRDASVLSKLGKIFREYDKANLYIDKIEKYDYEIVKKYEHINNAYLYCLYKEKISKYDYEEATFDDFIKTAEKIVNNCEQRVAQQYKFNPYVLTVYKVIKTIKNRASINVYTITKWSNRLDPNKLPTEPITITADGKEREMAPFKEFWYQTKSKCLKKTGQYQECIDLCDEALRIFDKFHYNYNLWFMARKLYCECKISNSEEALRQYQEIADKNHFWYMYHKLGNLYFSNAKIDSSLICLSKALLWDEIDPDKKINLFYDLGLVFEAKSKINEAKQFFQCCLYYRTLYRWNIDEKLKYVKYSLDLDENKKPNLTELYNICFNELQSLIDLQYGKVKAINISRKFGILIYKNNTITFSLYNHNLKLKQGNFVGFKIGKYNDKEVAVEVYLDKRRNYGKRNIN